MVATSREELGTCIEGTMVGYNSLYINLSDNRSTVASVGIERVRRASRKDRVSISGEKDLSHIKCFR